MCLCVCLCDEQSDFDYVTSVSERRNRKEWKTKVYLRQLITTTAAALVWACGRSESSSTIAIILHTVVPHNQPLLSLHFDGLVVVVVQCVCVCSDRVNNHHHHQKMSHSLFFLHCLHCSALLFCREIHAGRLCQSREEAELCAQCSPVTSTHTSTLLN